MNVRSTLPPLGACLLTLSLSAQAVDPDAGQAVDLGIALRVGYHSNAPGALMSSLFGFGLRGAVPVAKDAFLDLEACYFTEAGRQYVAPPLPAAPGRPQADPSQSVDSKRNSLQGLGLRASYRRVLAGPFSLQGGLMAAKVRYRQDYLGQDAEGLNGTPAYQDTYNGNPTHGAVRLSPFAGVSWRIDADNRVDFNLMGFSYQSIDFQHTPGSPLVSGDPKVAGSTLVYAGDRLNVKNQMGLTLEISYGFRF